MATVRRIVDEAVNKELGLPAAAGNNTAILNGNLEEVAAEARQSQRIAVEPFSSQLL